MQTEAPRTLLFGGSLLLAAGLSLFLTASDAADAGASGGKAGTGSAALAPAAPVPAAERQPPLLGPVFAQLPHTAELRAEATEGPYRDFAAYCERHGGAAAVPGQDWLACNPSDAVDPATPAPDPYRVAGLFTTRDAAQASLHLAVLTAKGWYLTAPVVQRSLDPGAPRFAVVGLRARLRDAAPGGAPELSVRVRTTTTARAVPGDAGVRAETEDEVLVICGLAGGLRCTPPIPTLHGRRTKAHRGDGEETTSFVQQRLTVRYVDGWVEIGDRETDGSGPLQILGRRRLVLAPDPPSTHGPVVLRRSSPLR